MMTSAPRITVPPLVNGALEQFDSERSFGMDGLIPFLEMVRDRKLAAGRLRGFLHICIGRRVTKTDGTLVSAGVTWRELSVLLKDAKFDKDLASQVGADPDALSPRDRQRFWYSVIALARPDSFEARTEAEALVGVLKTAGYQVGPAPTVSGKPLPSPEPDGDPKKALPVKPKKKGK